MIKGAIEDENYSIFSQVAANALMVKLAGAIR
jgi:hypothetical protein